MSPKILNQIRLTWEKVENSKISRILLYTCLSAFMIAVMFSNVTPNKFDAKLYSVAKQDIQSPINIINAKETQIKKAKAAASVKDQYRYDEDKGLNQIIAIEDMFASIKTVQNGAENDIGQVQVNQRNERNPENSANNGDRYKDKIDHIKGVLPGFIAENINDETLTTLMNTSPSELSFSKEVSSTAIKSVMNQRITLDQIEEKKKEVIPLITASHLPKELKAALVNVSKSAIISNYTFDAEATKKLREEAMNNVDPVHIREGEILVEQGQTINIDTLYQLKLVGLLKDNFSPYPYLGLGLLVLLMVSFLFYFLRELVGEKQKENSILIMYMLLFSLTVILLKIASLLSIYYPAVAFIVPVALGTMMIKMLINEQIALISSMVFAICGSLIFNENTTSPFNFTFGAYILISSLAGVVFLGKRNVKGKILKTGIFVALINVLSVFVILGLSNGNYDIWNITSQVAFSLLSGFLSAVLTLGLLPFFEAGFGILTSLKLIELSNPNHPLLRKLLMETPGTYHHSVVVANLSEAACEAVGANGLLARVGAYYHDLGKTKRPHFFIENQLNLENPHDKISPQLSRTIIIAHPYNGVEMLRKHKIPKEIVDIAEQHHGTTLLKYFYHKALQQTEKGVVESDFRYPGPKAQSKEAAIIGIADAVEAAVRSMPKPTPARIESLVRKISAERLEDGQFNECSITLKELEIVIITICETLQGMFHSRIGYPEEILKKKVSQA